MNTKILNKKIEALSCISFYEKDKRFILVDELMDKRYIINSTAYMICQLINGNRNILEICNELVKNYRISEEEVQGDVLNFYKFLYKNKLIILKGTLKYNLILLYQYCILINKKLGDQHELKKRSDLEK